MKSLFTIAFYFLITFSCFGQSMQTAYEKKCYLLTVQFFKKLGISESILNKSNKLSDLENLFLMGNIVQKLNTQEGLMLLLTYNKEMKEAEHLKTSIDFQRERDKKNKEEQAARQREIGYQKKQAILEKENLEKERLFKYNNSDIVKVKSEALEKFQSWIKKGEFEKSEQYEKRLKENAKEIFEKINSDAIQDRLDNSKKVKFQLGTYNADNEYFPLKIEYKDLKWEDTVQIQVDNAAEFKENLGYKNTIIKFMNWGVYDNNLYPNKIIVNLLDPNKTFESHLPISNLNDYNVTPNSLGLSSNNLADIEFSFFNYQREKEKIEIEKQQELIRREIEEKKEIENIKLARSDYGKILSEIKTKLYRWAEKNKFESNSEFQNRLKNEKEIQFFKIKNEIISLNDSLNKDNLCVKGEFGNFNSENKQLVIFPRTTLRDDKTVIFVSSEFNHSLSSNYNNIIGKTKYQISISSELAKWINQNQNKVSVVIIPKKFIIYNNTYTISNAYIILNFNEIQEPSVMFNNFKTSEGLITIDYGKSYQAEKNLNSLPLLERILAKKEFKRDIANRLRQIKSITELEENFKESSYFPKGLYYYYWQLENDPSFHKNNVKDLLNISITEVEENAKINPL